MLLGQDTADTGAATKLEERKSYFRSFFSNQPAARALSIYATYAKQANVKLSQWLAQGESSFGVDRATKVQDIRTDLNAIGQVINEAYPPEELAGAEMQRMWDQISSQIEIFNNRISSLSAFDPAKGAAREAEIAAIQEGLKSGDLEGPAFTKALKALYLKRSYDRTDPFSQTGAAAAIRANYTEADYRQALKEVEETKEKSNISTLLIAAAAGTLAFFALK